MVEQNTALAEQPEEAAPEEDKREPRGPLIPPILVRGAIIGGILAGLAVGAIFVVTDVIAPRIRAMGQPEAAAAMAENGVESGVGKSAGKAKENTPGEILTVSDLIVNPAGTGGRRYLKVAAAIEVHAGKEKKSKEEGGTGLREVQIRDLLIRELSARNLEELTDPTAKEEMRQSILAELNNLLGEGRVTNLYFTEYVVQ